MEDGDQKWKEKQHQIQIVYKIEVLRILYGNIMEGEMRRALNEIRNNDEIRLCSKRTEQRVKKDGNVKRWYEVVRGNWKDWEKNKHNHLGINTYIQNLNTDIRQWIRRNRRKLTIDGEKEWAR